MKICSYCKENKPLEMYYLSKEYKDWRRCVCIECARKYGRIRYYLRKLHPVVEVKAPAPRVNVLEWIKRLFYK